MKLAFSRLKFAMSCISREKMLKYSHSPINIILIEAD